MRTTITYDPFEDLAVGWPRRGNWPASWISHPRACGPEAGVTAYRLSFCLAAAATVRVHVTADERYELFLDGERLGRGPERGDRENWFFETHDLNLAAGEHLLVARTWWLGTQPGSPAPYAQMSVRPGFLLAAENQPPELCNTGEAAWETKLLSGYDWIPSEMTWGTGCKVRIKGVEFDWGYERGEGEGWEAPEIVAIARGATWANEHPPLWKLRPATLPPMRETPRQVGRARHVQAVVSDDTADLPVSAPDHLPEEAAGWDALLRGESPLILPPHTQRRVIVDLGDYYCAYPELIASAGAGALVRVQWAEGLFEDPAAGVKGNRDEIEGKVFQGVGDIFEPDGGQQRPFETLWWECGRYLEVYLSTADQPLTLDAFRLRETHYPHDFLADFDCSDPRLATVTPLAQRVLEMCSHETYMDCPYYEQLQYIGDTRLQALVTYATTGDPRLPRKALLMFDASRQLTGLTQSRYPSRVTQIIPPFSLWWVAMIHDYALWQDDLEFVAERMRGARCVVDYYADLINADGLLESPRGWNFTDWVPEWTNQGVPPDGEFGISGVLNVQTALILRQAAQLEEWMGEAELAARNRRLADTLATGVQGAFWSDSRGLLADDLTHEHFSEHSQCLALLAEPLGGVLPPDRREAMIQGLLEAPDLARTTIYFMHYLFETYRLLGRVDLLIERLGLWFKLPGLGFRTTLESPEPSRSDCHAWGAHPLFHYLATILGLRPAEPGFRSVFLQPQLGPLTGARGAMPHPRGEIRIEVSREEGELRGEVQLPEGVTGQLLWEGETRSLAGGEPVFL